MKKRWIDEEQMRQTERERALEKRRVVYVKSDLYPQGEFLPELEARISVFDRGFTVGDSAYEYARTYRRAPFQVAEHMDRMFTSLKVLRINPGFTKEEFCALCNEVTRRNAQLLTDQEELNIIWEVTRGEWGWHGRRIPIPEGKGAPTVIVKNNLNDQRICAQPFSTGVHLVSPPGRHVSPQCYDPKIKTYSRLSYVLAENEARLVDPGAIAVLLDEHGNLAEAIGANVWIVMGGELLTPPDANILRGQTRANVIERAKQLDLTVVERHLQPWHLYNCDEAFLSSTFPGPLQPIGRFNGMLVGDGLPGPVTTRLAKAWSDAVGIDVTGLDRLSAEEKAILAQERNDLNRQRSTIEHVSF